MGSTTEFGDSITVHVVQAEHTPCLSEEPVEDEPLVTEEDAVDVQAC